MELLDYLHHLGFDGIYKLLYGSMVSLIERRERRSSEQTSIEERMSSEEETSQEMRTEEDE